MIAANHRSYFDPLVLAMPVRVGAVARFLAKKEMFDAPLVGAVVRSMGAIPVNRGTGSDEPLVAAARALDAGKRW